MPEITLKVVKEWWGGISQRKADKIAGDFVIACLWSSKANSADWDVVRERFRAWCEERRKRLILDWLTRKGRLET